MKHVKNDKLLLCILGFAFALRLFYFIAIMAESPENLWVFDSHKYKKVAENVINHGAYSSQPHEPLIPCSYRMPLYPLLFATIGSPGNGALIILLQLIVSTLSCLLVFELCRTITGSSKAGYIAAALLAIDIPSIVYANYLLTETFLTFLFLLSVRWFIIFIKNKEKNKYLLFSGLALGASMLAKPVSLYATIIFLLMLIYVFRKNFRALFIKSAVFLGGVLLIICPWLVRNYITFDSILFSTTGRVTLCSRQGGSIYAVKYNMVFFKAKKKLWHELRQEFNKRGAFDPVAYARYVSKETTKIILRHPVIFLKEHFRNIIQLVLKPALSQIDSQLGFSKGQGVINDYTKIIDPSSFESISRKASILSIALAVLQIVLMIITYIGIAIGAVYMWKNSNRFYMVFLCVIIFYFLNITTPPIAYVQMKIPVIPFFAVFGGIGLASIVSKYHFTFLYPHSIDQDYMK